MGKGFSITAMVIITKDSTLTECLRALESIFGLMAAHTRGISSRDKEVDMEFGWLIRIGCKDTEAITQTTRRQGMEYTPGTMAGNTRATSKMTIAMGMANSMTRKESSNTKDSGKMVSNRTKK